MSNFGKDISESSNYDTTRLFNQVIPYLKKLKALGVQSIFDCTTKYFGRRIDLLSKISDSSGIQIITNTGFYGAANDRYIPEFVFKMHAKSISEIWIKEFRFGINGTDIKPGFVKLAFDNGSPSDIDKKLFTAGVVTHLGTGMTLAVHTGDNLEAVNLQMEILKKFDVHPSAWVWVHANKCEDDKLLIDVASKGAWISLDGVNESNTEEYINRIKLFKDKDLLNKVLLSHDGNGYPSGGEIRKFEALFTDLIPQLLKYGLTKEDINQILITNPKTAFQAKIRTR
jgi:phosphotriesterase-related protein